MFRVVFKLAFLIFVVRSYAVAAPNNERPDTPADGRPVWHVDSANGIYHLSVGLFENELHIGKFQQWIIVVLDSDRSPVYPAQVSIGGGMFGHQHGLPTQPQVTAYLGDGRYLIEGMKLSMEGEWTLVFDIQSEKGKDSASVAIMAEF